MQVLKVAYVLLSFFYVVTACAVFLEALAAVPRRRLRPVRDGLREVSTLACLAVAGRCAPDVGEHLEYGRVAHTLQRARCLSRRSVGDPSQPCARHPLRAPPLEAKRAAVQG